MIAIVLILVIATMYKSFRPVLAAMVGLLVLGGAVIAVVNVVTGNP
ncbi:MAG: hypothetical protein NVS3B1_06190 [Marmoricola sp.]